MGGFCVIDAAVILPLCLGAVPLFLINPSQIHWKPLDLRVLAHLSLDDLLRFTVVSGFQQAGEVIGIAVVVRLFPEQFGEQGGRFFIFLTLIILYSQLLLLRPALGAEGLQAAA